MYLRLTLSSCLYILGCFHVSETLETAGQGCGDYRWMPPNPVGPDLTDHKPSTRTCRPGADEKNGATSRPRSPEAPYRADRRHERPNAELILAFTPGLLVEGLESKIRRTTRSSDIAPHAVHRFSRLPACGRQAEYSGTGYRSVRIRGNARKQAQLTRADLVINQALSD
jgi:hypothetical protein